MENLIITAAITGSIVIPSQTPYLPITPKEIADEAVRAAEAGAASVHIHARDPKTGRPSADLNLYQEIIQRIKDRSDVIICITTGGGLGMTIEERARSIPEFKPELASFNMGSLNFALYPIAERRKDKEYQFPWEKEYLEMTKDFVLRNTFADMEYFCKTMRDNNTRPEHEAYDVGHLYNTHHLMQRGLLESPLWIQFVMGVLGGIMPTVEDVIHMKETADRLFGPENYHWSVIGVGYPQEFRLGTLAVMMGGHVRVGMEDNIRISKGVLVKSNAELVEKMVRIAGELDRDIASADEARKMLRLKGKENVNF